MFAGFAFKGFSKPNLFLSPNMGIFIWRLKEYVIFVEELEKYIRVLYVETWCAGNVIISKKVSAGYVKGLQGEFSYCAHFLK